MRPGEFYEALDAFRKEAEANRKHTGELARGLGVRIVNLFVKKGNQFNDASKFWQMPWDQERESLTDVVHSLDQLTDEERDEKARQFLASISNG